MPASANATTVVDVNVVGVWADFLAMEASARGARDTAWDALNPVDPINTMQSAFDGYQSLLNTAFENAQATLRGTITEVQEWCQDLFNLFQDALTGGGIYGPGATVANGLTLADQMNNAMDGGLGIGGAQDQTVRGGSDTNVFYISMKTSDIRSSNGFEFNSGSNVFVDDVTLTADGYSKATVSLRFVDKEDTVPAVVGLGNKGPVDRNLFGARGKAVSSVGGITVFCGSLVTTSEDLESDGASFIYLDDKYFLEGVHVRGTFHFLPDDSKENAKAEKAGNQGGITGAVYYNHAGQAIFNPNGRPNCIDTPGGPLFAIYPDFGLEIGEPISIITSRTKVRYWTLGDIFEYLRLTCYGDTAKPYTNFLASYLTLSTDRVIWPEGLGSSIKADPTITGGDRAAVAGVKDNDTTKAELYKISDLDLSGQDLHTVLRTLASSAGGYGLFMYPQPTGRSAISLVPTRYTPGKKNSTDRGIVRQTGTWGKNNTPKLARGSIESDVGAAFSSVAVDGDTVWLELRFTYDPSDLDPTHTNLLKGWAPDDETILIQYIKNPNQTPNYPKSVQAYMDAVNINPEVFSAFAPDANFDWYKGTKYEKFPRLPTPPQVLSHLLTYYMETGHGSLKRRFPLPVQVEIKEKLPSGLFGAWRVAEANNGFEVDEQGTLYFPGLRDLSLGGENRGTWVGKITDPDGTNNSDHMMRTRPIRMTLAIGLNIRLTAAMGFNLGEYLQTVQDVNKNTLTGDPNGDAQFFVDRFQRQYLADVGDGFREYLRKDAYPIPQSVNSTQAFNGIQVDTHALGTEGRKDHCTLGDELLKDEIPMIRTFAKRRFPAVGRVQRTCHLVFENFMFMLPGVKVARITTEGTKSGEKKLNSVVHKWHASFNEQICEIDLG